MIYDPAMLIFLEALCAIAALFGYVFGVAFLVVTTSNGAPYGASTTATAMWNILVACIPFMMGTLGVVGICVIEASDKARAEQTAGFQHIAGLLHAQQTQTQAVEQLAAAIRTQGIGGPR